VSVLVSVGLSIPCVNVLGAAGGGSLRKMREYWLFALWCALMLGLAEWPRGHYESAALTAGPQLNITALGLGAFLEQLIESRII
jgi:hypothetical protein